MTVIVINCFIFYENNSLQYMILKVIVIIFLSNKPPYKIILIALIYYIIEKLIILSIRLTIYNGFYSKLEFFIIFVWSRYINL